MGKFSFEEVNELYMDILKEIGNIGAGNATTAIASMLDLRLNMNVPKVELLSFQEFGSAISEEEETIVGIYLGLENDVEGSMMFLLKMDSAYYLVNRLMGRDPEYREKFTEMDLSAIKEIGNIIAGSYLSALSGMTNLTISPTVPYVAIDMAAAILSVPACMFGQYGDNALLIETEFGDDVMIEGYFILLPELDSYDKILESLGITI
ncbi:MAG: chemotaxis protein CheC [Lachnospiraceae bacterium]|nr:chemotaxis protein CheC [Lachnospiraceae bacterium]